jgi:hypothetical protein
MASVYKVLGQLDPAATTLSTLYTVPALTSTVVSSIVVCNRDTVARSYRVAIRPAGAAIDPKHYIAYDIPLDGNESFVWTLGITLATTDVISVYASAQQLAFSAFGEENS